MRPKFVFKKLLVRLRRRLFLVLIVLFVVTISYKIIEPELFPPSVPDFTNIDWHNEHEEEIDLDEEDKPVKIAPPDGGNREWQSHLSVSQAVAKKVEHFIQKYNLDWSRKMKPEVENWDIPASWVTDRQVHPDKAPELGSILSMMSTSKIMKADVGRGGTQLKMTLWLEGGQVVVFKPKWFERDYIVPGQAWNGGDRHNGEIAAFHLNRLLGYNRAPLAVGRIINLHDEIIPVGSEALVKTFFHRDKNSCFFGKCYYCKGPEDGVCGAGEMLEGVVTLWLPKSATMTTLPHPWRRSYTTQAKKWEQDNNYCQTDVLTNDHWQTEPYLLDLLDVTVIDYLILNGDRHHYQAFNPKNDGVMVLLDNGKSFGNPDMDDDSIMAPLTQCCRLRNQTYQRLLELRSGVLSIVMSAILHHDPISPVLTDPHLNALDRRLENILEAVTECIKTNGEKAVLLTDKYSR